DFARRAEAVRDRSAVSLASPSAPSQSASTASMSWMIVSQRLTGMEVSAWTLCRVVTAGAGQGPDQTADADPVDAVVADLGGLTPCAAAPAAARCRRGPWRPRPEPGAGCRRWR